MSARASSTNGPNERERQRKRGRRGSPNLMSKCIIIVGRADVSCATVFIFLHLEPNNGVVKNIPAR